MFLTTVIFKDVSSIHEIVEMWMTFLVEKVSDKHSHISLNFEECQRNRTERRIAMKTSIKVLAYYGNMQLNFKWLSDSEICTNLQFA